MAVAKGRQMTKVPMHSEQMGMKKKIGKLRQYHACERRISSQQKMSEPKSLGTREKKEFSFLKN